ncbi:hypothetical protein CBR_g30320 [Chara braunii]|uniref:Uncharacterized protein n=1 Tax=Chara braunii TaxID=69332 RepID=A0A388JX48_CHABU|nr:hypothetical protein CBR_g30320 [Chara braunii]|eukprot:GBG62366.1 hypothetical protein CBR_g30320 [Chara braunii]
MNVFTNKLSGWLAKGLGKLKASFQATPDGRIIAPILGISRKDFTADYSLVDKAAFLTASTNIGKQLRVTYEHDVKSKEGSIVARAVSKDDKFKAHAVFSVNHNVMKRGSLRFPNGEVEYLHDSEDPDDVPGVRGFIGFPALNGLFLAEGHNTTKTAKLKYTYKDENLTISPAIELPSQALSLRFKRQFNPYHKLSFFYDLHNVYWQAVYKHKPQTQNNFVYKAGYDSESKIAWAAVWAGKPADGARHAGPLGKWQLMIQVPREDVSKAVLLVKVKKRWDFELPSASAKS